MDPITIALIATAVVSSGTAIHSGMQQKKQSKKQAALMEEDAANRAAEETRQAKEHRKRQKVAFLKSGVALSGSPLLIMQETLERGLGNSDAIKETGGAKASLLRAQGQSALVTGFGNAGTSALKGFSAAASANSGTPKQFNEKMLFDN